MTREQTIAEFESACVPILRQYQEIAAEIHPKFQIDVFSGSVGSHTTFQGYHAGLDCCRRGSADPEPNCLALYIGIAHLDTDPWLDSLGVAWGAEGVGPGETLDLYEEAIPWGPEACTSIKDALPKLFDNFMACLTAWENAYLSGA